MRRNYKRKLKKSDGAEDIKLPPPSPVTHRTPRKRVHASEDLQDRIRRIEERVSKIENDQIVPDSPSTYIETGRVLKTFQDLIKNANPIKQFSSPPPYRKFLFPEKCSPLFTEDSLTPGLLGSRLFKEMTATKFQFLIKSELIYLGGLHDRQKAAICECCLLLASIAKSEMVATRAFQVLINDAYWKFDICIFDKIFINWGMQLAEPQSAEGIPSESSSSQNFLTGKCKAPSQFNVKLVCKALMKCLEFFSPEELKRTVERLAKLSLDPLLHLQSHLVAEPIQGCFQRLIKGKHYIIEDLAEDFVLEGIELPTQVFLCMVVIPKTEIGTEIATVASLKVLSSILNHQLPRYGIVTFADLAEMVTGCQNTLASFARWEAYQCFVLIDFIMALIQNRKKDQSYRESVSKIINIAHALELSSNMYEASHFNHIIMRMERYVIDF